MDDREVGRMVAGAPDPAVHVGRAEMWRAARAPTDTWQGTARDLRKQPPRDTQQGGVGGPKETRPAPPLACVPIRASSVGISPTTTHQNPQQQKP
jgi:hypothetical protein